MPSETIVTGGPISHPTRLPVPCSEMGDLPAIRVAVIWMSRLFSEVRKSNIDEATM